MWWSYQGQSRYEVFFFFFSQWGFMIGVNSFLLQETGETKIENCRVQFISVLGYSYLSELSTGT
jgi:hypothetical protein